MLNGEIHQQITPEMVISVHLSSCTRNHATNIVLSRDEKCVCKSSRQPFQSQRRKHVCHTRLQTVNWAIFESPALLRVKMTIFIFHQQSRLEQTVFKIAEKFTISKIQILASLSFQKKPKSGNASYKTVFENRETYRI